MRVVWVVCLVSAAGFTHGPALAQQAIDGESGFDDCYVPHRPLGPRQTTTRASIFLESEPNDSPGFATSIPLNHSNPDVDVAAFLNPEGDQDWFAISLDKGDILGVAVLSAIADPEVSIFNIGASKHYVTNDYGYNIYPPSSPLPLPSISTDAIASFVCPADGYYAIRVGGSGAADYTCQLRLRRQPMESAPAGTHQIIFLDFNGATINAPALYEGGNNPATLSPLSSFLADWGLTPADEPAVVDAITQNVRAKLEFVSSENPTFALTVLNSHDDPDPFGAPNVTRVIIGGTQDQLGIPGLLGIAESIDPGNFATSETGLVLLDILSDPNPSTPGSINGVERDPAYTIIDAIGRGVGNIAAHEAGHMLGIFHTDPFNTTYAIMDQGGVPLDIYYRNRFETGPDLIMGNADDEPSHFSADDYTPSESASSISPSIENVHVRIAVALSGTTCDADLDGSGLIDGADLATLLAAWGMGGVPADLNGDGIVDGADLAVLLATWGLCGS